MIYLHVYVHVKPEFVDAFIAATLANVEGSRKEAGNLLFDFVRQSDDPTRFVFIEAWKDTAAQAYHRDTFHYIKWREAVNPMMATQRVIHNYGVVVSERLGVKPA